MNDMQNLSEIASDLSAPIDVRRISASLVAAMNDWPMMNLESLDVFVSELKKEIGELSKSNIRQKMDRYSPVTDAWKGESLAELLGAWDIDDDVALLGDLIKRVLQR